MLTELLDAVRGRDFYQKLWAWRSKVKTFTWGKDGKALEEISNKDFKRRLRLKGSIGKPNSKKIKRLKREGKAFRVVCNLVEVL